MLKNNDDINYNPYRKYQYALEIYLDPYTIEKIFSH